MMDMENMLKKQFGSVLRLSEYLKNKVNVLYEEYSVNGTSLELINQDLAVMQKFVNNNFMKLIMSNNSVLTELASKEEPEVTKEPKPELESKPEPKPKTVIIPAKPVVDKHLEPFSGVDFDDDDDID